MNNALQTRRGRPRNFDRKQVLVKAMQAFWAHGYEGTSMTQLVDAMGIGSPSIYAAFGSKEELFREAVELYVASEASVAWWALEHVGNTQLAVQAIFFASIDAFFSGETPRGCLVVLGAGHLGGADEAVRAILREHRQQFRERLVARLRRGVKEGDLPSDTDHEALAACALAFFSGLSINATDGFPKALLYRSAELFCKRLFAV